MKRYIGCDVGQSGALVCISDEGVEIIPFDLENYRNALERWKADDCMAVVEKVSSMPGQGVSSTFSFGTNFGMIQGMLYALHIPTELVPPQTWKKMFSLNLNKSFSKAEKKARTIAKMKQLFPDVSLKRTERSRTDDDNIADALAIAFYCKRTYGD